MNAPRYSPIGRVYNFVVDLPPPKERPKWCEKTENIPCEKGQTRHQQKETRDPGFWLFILARSVTSLKTLVSSENGGFVKQNKLGTWISCVSSRERDPIKGEYPKPSVDICTNFDST